MIFQGVVVDIIFESNRDSYKVLLVEGDDEALVIQGALFGVQIGDSLELTGEMQEHPRFGEQMKVHSFRYVEPSDIYSIQMFLGSGHIQGVGPAMAERIVKAFGAKTMDVLNYDMEKLKTVPGIGEKTFEKIKSSYERMGAKREQLLFLQSHGISPLISARILSVYGDQAEKLIRENPYRLLWEVQGMGFESCDQLARRLGFELTDLRRLHAYIHRQLQRALNQGHVYLPYEVLKEQLDKIEGNFSEEDLRHLIVQGYFIYEKERVYLTEAYEAEGLVATDILRIMHGEPSTFCYDKDLLQSKLEHPLSLEQEDALLLTLEEPLTIITGGPGTGKTTLIQALVHLFHESIALAAPTGRAAKRMEEATGKEAKTIHRLLEYRFDEETGLLGFERDRDNPLEQKLIIIDEVSMVDLFLMHKLLEAVPQDGRLVFLGDENQLPSVGAGRILGDMIASGVVPVARLKQIFRQEKHSLIPLNASKVLIGEKDLKQDPEGDFFLLPSRGMEGLVDLVKNRLPSYYGFDPLWDIQVLSPVRSGGMGTWSLNRMLQEALNPFGGGKTIQHGDRVFRQGDKIMQTRNNYQIEWRDLEKGEEGQGIFNGDIGEILSIDGDEINLLFDKSKLASYTRDQLYDLEHAYAMTIHKSQGSEFPCVVLALEGVPYPLSNRNLLYTGMTRARKLLVLYWKGSSLERMIERVDSSKRFSGLDELLLAYSMEE